MLYVALLLCYSLPIWWEFWGVRYGVYGSRQGKTKVAAMFWSVHILIVDRGQDTFLTSGSGAETVKFLE